MADIKLKKHVPLLLKIEEGGWGCSSSTLSLSKGKLIYKVMDLQRGQYSEIITPSAQQWKDFRTALDDVGVWNWLGEYPNPGVYDGSYWELKISYADRKLMSIGDNNYPTAGGAPSGAPEYTRSFRRLIKAVKALIGKRKF